MMKIAESEIRYEEDDGIANLPFFRIALTNTQIKIYNSYRGCYEV